MIAVCTLGPIDVSVDGRPAPAELLWRKNLALLVYLARSPRRTRARDHLIGLLWADKPEAAARHSLNEALRVLRRSAGDDALETDAGRVALAPGTVELDTDRFEVLAAAGDWRGAAALVAGEFLEGFGVPEASEFDTWLGAERDVWRRRAVEALVRRADELLAAGDLRMGEDAARRALGLAPTSDASVRALIKCLALAGDRAGALEGYAAFAARLAGELGTEPDAETNALAERVRRERTWRRPGPAKPEMADAGESRRAPLVGRAVELERLLAAWAGCRGGRRATLALIDGDPGTGKTRLAEEVLARARLDGAAVAAVRAVEADLAEPWSGVFALARGGLREGPGVAAAPPAALAALAARIPEWAEQFAAAVRGVAPAGPGRALGDVLRALSDEQAVLLAVDDAHWLDGDSLLALAAAVRDLARAPLCILLTAAPHPPREELDDLRARLGRDLTGVAVSLGPLRTDALRVLTRWAMPRYGDAEINRLARRVATDSAGLPLLAVELLHAVALGLDLRESTGAWPEPFKTLDQSLPGELPDGVVAAIRIGFRRLSPDAQKVLQAAGVLGERVPANLLGRAAGLSAVAVAAALDELEWQRWLTADPRGYAFVARIVRDVVA
ncbi:MAG: AAA family ATPase, partial [Gemmatimonadetes bacterium]|nr:AAA family ATPase [Gemmatimonadota bacterium]